MKSAGILAALALTTSFVSSVALADDPNDPDMRDPRARARDRQIIRQLNIDELAHVRRRDAGYAAGWKAYREAKNGGGADYARARADNDRQRAGYNREQARHEQEMTAWRRAVSMCRAGHYEYCDH